MPHAIRRGVAPLNPQPRWPRATLSSSERPGHDQAEPKSTSVRHSLLQPKPVVELRTHQGVPTTYILSRRDVKGKQVPLAMEPGAVGGPAHFGDSLPNSEVGSPRMHYVVLGIA
jgi:hypothetical protein